MNFQQSRTFQNLLQAYEAELKISTRYLISGDIARQEGYIEISAFYEITARNQMEHARIWLRNLNNGTLPDTEQNLLDSSAIEAELGNKTYREYARIALEEGYNDIAALFNGVANIELNHNLRFRSFYDNFVRGELFCKPGETLWICMQCGNIMSGICAPEICPVCSFPQGYYRVYDNNVI